MNSRTYSYGLACLLALFCFRVGAQALQYFYPVEFLPPFEDWQSGALPYGVLAFSQALIIAGCLKVISDFREERIKPRRAADKILLGLGGLYFFIMLIRLIVGFTIAPDHPWWGARIPPSFHLVLAMFLILWGQFHFKYSLGKRKTASHD